MNTQEPARRRFHVDGVVQGVGFRPFVYGLATALGLGGWVRNTSAGVDIEVQGAPAALDAFAHSLREEAPPLAVIEAVQAQAIDPVPGADGFQIVHSEASGGISLIAPDVATCTDCRRELFDPEDRRCRYPFTNCTNCGPRFSIIRGLPYDRPQTTMQPFAMCPDCQTEYDDPADRRFHAQPNACPVCGPQVALTSGAVGDVAMREAADRLRRGEVVAVKGLGGFHLACDAANAAAVQRLRRRKGRPSKPFALMAPDLDAARAHGHISAAEAELLMSPAAPVVLLRRRTESPIAPNVAPDNHYLGVMLPYTPLHHILLHDVGGPLVMTSGNHTDEPLSYKNDAALEELGDIADAFLVHNRDIYMRSDDSVMMVVEEAPYPVRRSRGYAPYPVTIQHPHSDIATPDILAVGAGMKNTLCFLKGRRAFLSQHIGELDNLETLAYFEQAAAHLCEIFRAEPGAVAHDMHPDYFSTRWAKGELHAAADIAQLVPEGAPRTAVQHHHAHIAACMADNDYDDTGLRVIGIAWDGTGYGPDGAIWGGEHLVADYAWYERLAHLAYAPLPGGEAAIKRPARLAVAYLHHFLGEVPDLPGLARVGEVERRLVVQQVDRHYNTAWTSSMGRLFDVVAAMLGLCPEGVTFEAQAAIALEMLAHTASKEAVIPYLMRMKTRRPPYTLHPEPMLRRMAADVLAGADPAQIALRFHITLADHAVYLARRIRHRRGLNRVALSGGVWQNRLLLHLTRERLRTAGFEVLVHRRVPTNDGGLSLGQAAVARARLLNNQ